MQVSFLIPLYNCLPLTQAMLASLRATLPPGLAHEIIFVDDGSTDGTRAWLESLRSDPAVRVILNDANLGYAAANNRGAAVARGAFLALLNNDLVLTPRWLEPLLAVHARLGARAGLIGNVQRDLRTGVIDHAGIFINHKGKPEHHRSRPMLSHLSPIASAHRPVAALTGACVTIRRDLWAKLGGFDERFINGSEDIDLCLRARAAGHINAVALRSVVRHHISSSPGRKRRDEENSFKLTLRWRDELVRLGARDWCRNFLATHLPDPRDFAEPTFAWAALFYAWGLRPAPPAGALAGMDAAIDIELTRWRALFG